MGFEWADWRSKRKLNALVAQGRPYGKAIAFCRSAATSAHRAGRQSERIYLSSRLGELLAKDGRLNAARKEYDRLWNTAAPPQQYGFQYVKFLLRNDQRDRAGEVVREMQARLRTVSTKSPSYFDQLDVLLASGLVLLDGKRGVLAPSVRRRVKRICIDIDALRLHLPFVPHVDTDLLDALVLAHEFELARGFLDFISTVVPRPRKRG